MKKILLLIAVLALIITGCGSEELDGKVVLDNSIKTREGSIGKSDKDFLEITDKKPTTIRNDSTEKWRMVKFADNKDTLKHLLSYNKLYMTKDTTIHILTNFTMKTTTSVNDYGDHLIVDVYEYQDGEEHDAKEIGTGLLLAEYKIYKDNGDIIKN